MAQVKFEANGYPNYTEQAIGEMVYWRGDERERTIYCGQVVGIWVDCLWLVPFACSVKLGPFLDCHRRAPITTTHRAIWRAEPWLDKIPRPFPHEMYMEMRPVIPADLA